MLSYAFELAAVTSIGSSSGLRQLQRALAPAPAAALVAALAAALVAALATALAAALPVALRCSSGGHERAATAALAAGCLGGLAESQQDGLTRELASY